MSKDQPASQGPATREEVEALMRERTNLIETKRQQIEALEAERDKWHRRATDGVYMVNAYRNMLGPKGLEVAAMWEAKNTLRVHFDWQPEAWKLTGEERAALILEWESAPKRAMLPGEIDGL